MVIGRGQRRASERPGEIVHAGICIQTSPRVCVPINYTARPMSRYLPTYRSRFVCVCAAPRLVPLAPLPLLLFTRARRTHIPGGAPAARTYLITGLRRATSTICLYVVGDRLLPADDHVLSTPRFPNAHMDASAACHMPLNIAWMCDIGMAAALAHGALCGEVLRLNRRRFLLINCSCIVKFIHRKKNVLNFYKYLFE